MTSRFYVSKKKNSLTSKISSEGDISAGNLARRCALLPPAGNTSPGKECGTIELL